MNYLELVNLVVQESGKEMNELDPISWSSAEAGRRLYPRIKRYVAQAWKTIQMSREEWEFNTMQTSTTLRPRMLFVEGRGDPFAASESTMTGETSGVEVEIVNTSINFGDPNEGDAVGWLEFTASPTTNLIMGETFTNLDSDFIYSGVGGYKVSELISGLDYQGDDIGWASIMASRSDGLTQQVVYIPWNQWLYEQAGFSCTSNQLPMYASENPEGQMVFYPQPFNSFRVHLVVDLKPQTLVNYDDEPSRLPEEFHEWIAWEALMKLASYDKDPQLFGHASKQAFFFRNRAERLLMPTMCWGNNSFNE